jgi:hypothetical protein
LAEERLHGGEGIYATLLLFFFGFFAACVVVTEGFGKNGRYSRNHRATEWSGSPEMSGEGCGILWRMSKLLNAMRRPTSSWRRTHTESAMLAGHGHSPQDSMLHPWK